jgi:hypothetical protein
LPQPALVGDSPLHVFIAVGLLRVLALEAENERPVLRGLRSLDRGQVEARLGIRRDTNRRPENGRVRDSSAILRIALLLLQ